MSVGAEHQVCLLLGSNIRPEHNLPLAVDQLQKTLTILRISRAWETPPVGSTGPNFLNAAILAETSLNQEIPKTENSNAVGSPDGPGPLGGQECAATDRPGHHLLRRAGAGLHPLAFCP